MSHRGLVLGACGFAAALSVVTYSATGFAAFTRFPDPAVIETSQTDDLSSLFADTGLNDEAGEVGAVESRFALGLLPSGPGRASLSVATVVFGAGAVSLGTVLLGRRGKLSASSPSTDGRATTGA